MLLIEDLWAYYGRIPALRGVSLQVEEGSFVGVLGPNGAGKSTLLLTIAGIVRQHTGTVQFCGRPLSRASPDFIVRQGLSLVPEGRRIFTTLTVRENLEVGASARRDRQAVRRDIERMFELFPILGALGSTPAGKLSGGEQQQLAIARALVARPRMLLVDEPSLGLAPVVVDHVFKVLADLQRDGVTLLVVEQNAAKTLEAVERLYILRSGCVELDATATELRNSREFERIYAGLT